MKQISQPQERISLCLTLFITVMLITACGCQKKMSQEEADKAVAGFKGGPPGPDEAAIQAKERAAAAAYRKEHPENFPPFTK